MPATTYHLTNTVEVPDTKPQKYRCECTCGWKSMDLFSRKQAVNSGHMHRANMKVQAL